MQCNWRINQFHRPAPALDRRRPIWIGWMVRSRSRRMAPGTRGAWMFTCMPGCSRSRVRKANVDSAGPGADSDVHPPARGDRPAVRGTGLAHWARDSDRRRARNVGHGSRLRARRSTCLRCVHLNLRRRSTQAQGGLASCCNLPPPVCARGTGRIFLDASVTYDRQTLPFMSQVFLNLPGQCPDATYV
jgi:hypothetical protein